MNGRLDLLLRDGNSPQNGRGRSPGFSKQKKSALDRRGEVAGWLWGVLWELFLVFEKLFEKSIRRAFRRGSLVSSVWVAAVADNWLRGGPK